MSNASRRKGHDIDCNNNRDEQLYATNHNLNGGSARGRLNSRFQTKGGADFLHDRLDLFVEIGDDDGCHAMEKLDRAVFASNRPV
jgi:hypothetical protein